MDKKLIKEIKETRRNIYNGRIIPYKVNLCLFPVQNITNLIHVPIIKEYFLSNGGKEYMEFLNNSKTIKCKGNFVNSLY
jgi:hypothetical protein